MTSHRIGTRQEWLAARAELLEREKQLTRMGDELARQRRELPWVPVEKEYTLQTEHGARTLAELFDGRSQLVVYHFMFGPGYEAGCPSCSSTADGFNGVLAHLQARDVTMICVSRAPVGKLLGLPRAHGLELRLGLQPRQRLQRRLRRIGRGADDPRPRRAAARSERARAAETARKTSRPSVRTCRWSRRRTRPRPGPTSRVISPRDTASARSRARAAPSTTATPATPAAPSS